ncbi:hypothetical protein [Pseudomonas sp. P1.8]|jgi:hypothetical protein|uniref:hypothetical protein n=1 Tax=Pseudomonas sp. P1.8 TaxID=1699310 RepID=UPI0012E2DA70|nr:hypothetical protein [Pseudomonas sp. P1.8]
MRSIQQLGHKIEVIHIPHSGHQIIPILAGTKPISEFITMAETGDLDALRTAANRTRRSSTKRAQIAFEIFYKASFIKRKTYQQPFLPKQTRPTTIIQNRQQHPLKN